MPPKAGNKRSREPVERKKNENNWLFFFPSPNEPLNVRKYDLPQLCARLGWWYYNFHVRTEEGKELCGFASIFRRAYGKKEHEVSFENPYNQNLGACTWAIIDTEAQIYKPQATLDGRILDFAKANADSKPERSISGRIKQLFAEGRSTKPDMILKNAVTFPSDKFFVSLDDNVIMDLAPPEKSLLGKIPYDFSYHLLLNNKDDQVFADLRFTPLMKAVLHGSNGVVNEMFYYYIPHCHVQGTITLEGVTHNVAGEGWYDREFGGSETVAAWGGLDTWTWFSLLLDDGSTLSYFRVCTGEECTERHYFTVMTLPDGERIEVPDIVTNITNTWISLITFVKYGVKWTMDSKEHDIHLEIEAAYNFQEFLTIIVGGGFFEGRVNFTGTKNGKKVTGKGFAEQRLINNFSSTERYHKAVSDAVVELIQKHFTMNPSLDYINKELLGLNCIHRGVSPEVVSKIIIEPVRSIVDRGGKAWRGLLLSMLVMCLGKKYFDNERLIVFCELCHAGSLIIDDIQDQSTVRRGGQCAHVTYGLPIAINAGTCCYFMAIKLSHVTEDYPTHVATELMKQYYDSLCAGHVGQGLDIYGVDYLVPDAVETGNVTPLLDAIDAICAYKTGGPCATFCALACVICEADEVRERTFRSFGQTIGLAFQSVDDALNLRGFSHNRKEKGEDIRCGKVTRPIAMGIGRMNKADRQKTWKIISSRKCTSAELRWILKKLDEVKAVDDCLAQAREELQLAWKSIEGYLEDSFPKIVLQGIIDMLVQLTD